MKTTQQNRTAHTAVTASHTAVTARMIKWITPTLFVALGITFSLGPQVKVEPFPRAEIQLPSDLEAYLIRGESGVPNLRPELAKAIQWAHPQSKQKTPLSLVYFHGFSASRRELSPVMEELGVRLRANVFFTRLTGHAQGAEEMGGITLKDWFHDAEEALTIGKRLGDRVVLVGMSTGAALATWLRLQTLHAEPNEPIAALILLSPHFGLKDEKADLLLWPWGADIARLLIGDYREWKPSSVLQSQFWTTRYPVEALLPMMALVDWVKQQDLSVIRTPTQILYTERDEVLDTRQILKAHASLGADPKELVPVAEADNHIIAGDAVSPGTNAFVIDKIQDFLESLPGE